jgi:hypothetical protein
VSASTLLHVVVSAVTASGDAAELAAAQTQVQLNPFGALSTMLAWVVLVAVNAWCFQRILRHRPAGAGAEERI